ncbi:MAG: snapalysin family zinc-dependent metalloprotease [Actinophytocola sp.]|uniref:snapalysin family zinc-dependent metalloprotease n=1 Tax=Actinophytocola sp. TaxID=1872138 RepID=UPI00132A6541|nr:snapalysin family zinc-dependent metalloprotease [Actinophytocola sp.]MPZ84617.1 snapalysin family zinc-dependent metalloprotease [Actinophytocola sp.]
MLKRTVIGLFATALALVGGVVAPSASADVHAAAVTITYDDSQAAEFVDVVAQGVAIWNGAVENVQIEKASPGTDADITIIANDGWPQATLGPVFPGGSGTVWYGRQAVDEGYDVVRIAAHELGHNLGLPDMKPGPCSSLMSGSSAGVACTNPNPDAQEIAWVEENYADAEKPIERQTVVIGWLD